MSYPHSTDPEDYLQDHKYELLEEWIIKYPENYEAVLESFLENFKNMTYLDFEAWAIDQVHERLNSRPDYREDR